MESPTNTTNIAAVTTSRIRGNLERASTFHASHRAKADRPNTTSIVSLTRLKISAEVRVKIRGATRTHKNRQNLPVSGRRASNVRLTKEPPLLAGVLERVR